jgi:hypothetical protein
MKRVAVLLTIGLAAAWTTAGGARPTESSAAHQSDLSIAEAFVAHKCAKGSRRATNLWVGRAWTLNALYGDCGGGDGHLQHIWFFVGHRFVGRDTPGSSAAIIGLWGDGKTLAFLYVLYRPRDPLCCATGGGKTVRFHWNGKRVVRLDPLPPGTATPGRPGRYP